jgi:hypothetical protein
VDVVWHLLAHQPSTRRVHLLLLIRHGWAGATGVLLPLHATGILWAPATTLVVTLSHSGGNLHPLMRDVHLCAAIGQPILAVPHVAVVWEGLRPDRCLLLLASCQGPDHIHHTHQPCQVGPLERRLSDHSSRHPRPPDAADRVPNDQAQRLGGDPEAAQGLRARDWEIKHLMSHDLMAIMVLHDFLSRRITPLQNRARPTWLYTGEGDTT